MTLTRLLLTVLPFLAISRGQEIVVDLPEGRIAGHTLKSFLGNPFYAFQEIPYAAPPVGELRFAVPQNPLPWNGVLNTTRNTKQCIQSGLSAHVDPTAEQSEDCLYLNVYTPQIHGENKLPVFVWIHGGGFTSGSGIYNRVKPNRFMDYAIIVVSINYRLDALGFLTTGDGVISGNLGLKDQRLALRWVKSHIEVFGGDPDKITIGGQSAGSQCVGFQLLSQHSDGLFSGAVMESASPMSPSYMPNPRDVAFRLGAVLDPNLNSSSSNELLNLLRNAPLEDIVNASVALQDPGDIAAGNLIWAPVIENSTEDDLFLTTLMHDSFLNGNFHHVPVLMGINSEESLTFLDAARMVDLAGVYDKDISLVINKRLNVPEENRTFVGQELKKFYTNSTFSEDEAALVKIMSDTGCTTSMLRQAEISSKYIPVYFYQFSYMGALGEAVINGRIYVPGAVGVQHGEDLGYLLDLEIPSETNANDFLTMDRLLKLWTNFIKYRNPTPEPDPILSNITWPKLQGSDIKFLNINQTLEVQSNPRYYSRVSALLLQYMQQPYVVI